MMIVLGWTFLVYLVITFVIAGGLLWASREKLDQEVFAGSLTIGFGWPGILISFIILGTK